jgi:hypothetical protein
VTGVYMQEGTTSKVMVADRPYGEFYDFYSVSLKNFGYHLVYHAIMLPKSCYITSNKRWQHIPDLKINRNKEMAKTYFCEDIYNT